MDGYDGEFLMVGQNGRAVDVPEMLLRGASGTGRFRQRNAFLRIRSKFRRARPVLGSWTDGRFTWKRGFDISGAILHGLLICP